MPKELAATTNETTPITAPNTSAQDKITETINMENKILLRLRCKRPIGQVKTKVVLKELKDREKIRKYQPKLKEITADQKHQQNLERIERKTMMHWKQKQVSKFLKNHLKTESEEGIAAIYRIVISGSAAYKIHHSDIKQTVKTLDQLTSALNRERCELKSSAAYLNLLPKNSSREGQRHANFIC